MRKVDESDADCDASSIPLVCPNRASIDRRTAGADCPHRTDGEPTDLSGQVGHQSDQSCSSKSSDRPTSSTCSSRCSDRPSSCSSRTSDRPASCSSRSSDRPGSGRSGMSEKSGGPASRSGHLVHSRTGSTSSGDGLLLSVSALAARGGRPPSEVDKGCQDPDTDTTGGAGGPILSPEGDMGQAAARPPGEGGATPRPPGEGGATPRPPGEGGATPRPASEGGTPRAPGEGGDAAEEGAVGPPSLEREDPEGIDGTDSTGFSSLLSVDKRVFGRLQEELTAAQSELKLKEEEVTRLSRIRDDVEDELQELTASLFQEAHKMVREANVKAMQAEKALAESNMKVDGLLMEVAALKALVITSTPAKPNLHLHPHIGRKKSSERGGAGGSGSAPGTPTKERMVEGAEEEKKKFMDPILRNEYMQWKKLPTMDPDQPFFARIYREDINPCLEFPNGELGAWVRESVLENTLSINPVKDDEDLPRNCSLFEQPRRCTHTLTLGDADTQSHYVCQLARNRIAAVCDFVTYCRYVTQGLVKVHCNEVYWQIMERRRNMTVARLGFSEV